MLPFDLTFSGERFTIPSSMNEKANALKPMQGEATVSTVKIYLRAMRIPFLTGSLVPVFLTGAYAFTLNHLHWVPFLITGVGVALLQLAANTTNDYYDAISTDRVNIRFTRFSGGSRVIQEGLVSRKGMLMLSILLFAGAFAAGISLSWNLGPGIFLLGMIGFLGGWLYSFGPTSLMSRGFGEITIFLVFGPLLTWGTFYVMSGELTWHAFTLGIPPGFLIAAVIWINQFPDFEADSATKKQNLVVRLGVRRSRWIYASLMLFPFFTVLFMVVADWFSCLSLVSFLCLPLALKAIFVAWVHFDSHTEIVPAQALTIQTHLVFGLLLSTGLLLSYVLN
jgi:1,4-dihydroxy-2-naphthoate octaprenyltransferase